MLLSLPRLQGKYTEADALYARAIDSEERTLGPDHPDLIISLGNRAGVLHSQVSLRTHIREISKD